MKYFIIFLLIIFIQAETAYSYTESQREDCISSALNNPATKSIPSDLLVNYCDCALKAIIDENKDIRESGYQCALKNLN
tara:strand:- start:938 stop:1174 length:237 start_codon:yes stop_codon:yes gene_type:complete